MAKSFLSFLVHCLVAMALVDPADAIFHAKVPIFIAIIALWATISLSSTVRLKSVATVLLMSTVIPLLWTVIGMTDLRGADLNILKSFLFLLLLPIVCDEGLKLDRVIVKWSILVAVLTLATAVLSIVSPIAFSALYQFSLDKQNAIITTSRDQLGVGIGAFYYKTSPVMLLAFGWHAYRYLSGIGSRFAHLFFTLLFASALFLSGSRANVLGFFLVIGWILFRHLRYKCGWKTAVATCGIAVLLLGSLYARRFFDPHEESNSVKLRHYHSYLEEFDRHPERLIWGQGAGTSFYSAGFDDYTSVTELSYLELVRQFGIPVTLVLLALLAYPVILLARSYKGRNETIWLAAAYTGYLFVAATNPLLLSSTGMLVVVAVWSAGLNSHAASFRLIRAAA